MKPYSALIGMILIVLMITAPATAATTSTTSTGSSSTTAGSTTTLSPEQAVGQVYVSSVTLSPESYYPYEEGTITVQLTNSGSQSVALGRADLIDNNIILKNENSYNTMIYLGPGNTMTYTFQVMAKPPDGTYFPLFTAASRDAGSIRYPIKVDVDSTDIVATISEKPNDFAVSTKDRVNLSIINPRSGKIDNIIITPKGTGFDVNPAQQFISSLPAGSSVKIPFDITPYQRSNVIFHISYRNGPTNVHTMDVGLPLNTGEDKQATIPVVNNIAITAQGSSYKLTGDVSNAGITDAKALVLTTGSPARPVDPYPEYAIGSLASDDFSSFELTFAATDLSSVPVVITWKDADGNSFSTTKNLDLQSSAGSTTSGTGTGNSATSRTTGSSALRSSGFPGSGGAPGGGSIFGFGGSRSGGLSAFYPVIVGGVIAAIALVLYVKRKWIRAKLKKKG